MTGVAVVLACALAVPAVADPGDVQVDLTASGVRLSLLHQSTVRDVLDGLCRGVAADCELSAELAHIGLPAPLTWTGTWDTIVARVLEGTSINFVTMPGDASRRARLVVLGSGGAASKPVRPSDAALPQAVAGMNEVVPEAFQVAAPPEPEPETEPAPPTIQTERGAQPLMGFQAAPEMMDAPVPDMEPPPPPPVEMPKPANEVPPAGSQGGVTVAPWATTVSTPGPIVRRSGDKPKP